MQFTRARTCIGVLISAALSASLPALAAMPHARGAGAISGRIVDPDGLLRVGATLVVLRPDAPTVVPKSVTIADDMSFRILDLEPGVYVLALNANPHAPPQGDNLLALEVVSLRDDTRDVLLTVRKQIAIPGTLRFEGAGAATPLPPQVTVNAFLALDGIPLSSATSAVAEGNTFVLRNAFGQRVIRCGYTLLPNSYWWPSRVLLDDVDITNTPTDFSTKHGKLVVVFTRTPSRIRGEVRDDSGRSVPRAWLLFTAQSPTSWQPWSTTADVVQADPLGRFTAVLPSARYRINAFPSDTFVSRQAARKSMARVALGGVVVLLTEGESKDVVVALQRR